MLFKFLFNKKNVESLAKELAKETNSQLNENYQKHENKLDQITEVLHMLTHKVTDLEKRLSTKEIKDHATYGHIQYKIGELKTDLSPRKKTSNN